jgi:hypothetical protein
MTHSRLLQTLLLSTMLLGSACVADSDGTDQTDSSADDTVVHLMPLHTPDAKVSNSAPAGALLRNFGGPLLKNISVHPVFWNSSTQFQSNLNAFYNAVTASPLWSMLTQYGIGNGSGVAGIVDSKTTTSVTDSAIHTELNNLFAAGRLPLPNSNNYYPVHFPSGVSITSPDGSKSCVVFCAYHGTYVRNGVNVNYGVIPDQGGGCAGGCGNNSQRVNNLDSVTSHELIEATTDPAVGLATVIGAPLAWYDPTNGEIGDICNGQQGTTVGRDGLTYVIQLEFSNSARNCVAR